MTPHNRANYGEIAKVVLMPGDPLRAKWIAEHFLEDVKLVNDVRGMYCFTGTYKGKEISVMAHGMGIPSIGIYTYELFKFYDVDTIIRIGSAGSYVPEVQVNDVILVSEAYSDSTFAEGLGIKADKVLKANQELNALIEKTANEENIALKVGRCNSADVFYSDEKLETLVSKTQAVCVEMESFGLFANAQLLNKKAATLLTCSDSLVTGESLDATSRQTTFKNMVTLALDSAIKLL
ncbi:purine-nucleoside phosphorylase [Ureaplasma ceti]|uniref:Uridine phosphorylase n=1 Tax=Ureaplasma ceti TaxID=3119530 RepID=A0ABP9U9D6_9BACT